MSELCALEMSDLTLSDRKGKVKVRHGKGAKQRDVPLNAAALRALRAWLEVRPDAVGTHGRASVFIGKKG